MNILMVNYSEVTYPGGVHRTILEISKNLSKKGHKVTVLQCNSMNLNDYEEYEGFEIIRIKSRIADHCYGLSPEIFKFIKTDLLDIEPDIVHVHGHHTLFSHQVIYLLNKFYPDIPIIFSPHLDVSRSSLAGKYFWNLYNNLCRYTFGKCKQIISPSNFEAVQIFKLFMIPLNEIKVISHGVDSITPPKVKDKEMINLIYAGHLVHRKGLDFILNALKSLVYDYHVENVILKIIGEGPEKNKLLNISKDLKLEDYIVWEPFLPRDELIKEISESSIFILLSRSEAYGITVAESLSLGTPCIVTNRSALKEFMDEPGCFGVNYPPIPKDVAELIINISNSKTIVGPFTNKIRTWKQVVQDYEKVYKNVFNEEKR